MVRREFSQTQKLHLSLTERELGGDEDVTRTRPSVQAIAP